MSFAQSVIPKPRSVTSGSGEFLLGAGTAIDADHGSMQVAEMLRDQLRPATGFSFPLSSSGSSVIRLRVDKGASQGPEGYTLQVSPHLIEIKGATWAGVFYGTRTLLQLLPPDIFRKSPSDGVRWAVPSLTIDDAPRFHWRGSLMDVSRHFEPKEFILKFIDLLALHKMNVFQMHLTDDNGWRVEIKRYPKLTELGSKTDFSAMNPDGATRSINVPPGGFYTQEDVKEIVRYAAARNVTVMPEIEMPGHAGAAILAYPELGNLQQVKAGGGVADFYDNVYNVDDSTIRFLHNVLDEVLALFPSKFIHIGGDEVWKEPWHRNPIAQARIKQLGLKNEEELQSWFIKQMDDYMVAKGRRLVGWDEILEGGLAPNATVMSWRGIDGGIAAAKQGHDVVMAPTSHTYLDYYQSKVHTIEPRGIGGFLPLETVYSFEPIPDALTGDEAKHILGAQGQLWSEFIPHPKHMEYMAFPRLCALAEVDWSPKEARNWDDFVSRLKDHLRRLDVLDVHYRPLNKPEPAPVGSWKSGELSESWSDREWPATGVDGAGSYVVTFSYSSGGMRLDIGRVDLLEDGKVVATDEHSGQTGAWDHLNSYRLVLKEFKAGARYSVRGHIRTDGGNDSNGDVFVAKG
jgi:hexosaminidase